MSVDCPLTIAGREVPPTVVGNLVDSDPNDDVAADMHARGYLLLRNAIESDLVAVARNYVCQQLVAVDEIEIRDSQAIATGRSRRRELHADLGLFWQQISEAAPLRQCVHSQSLHTLFGKLFREAARPFDFVWLRAFSRGRASPLHIDHPYMNRGTDRAVSCWIPLGNVNPAGGGLFLIENSNQIQSLRDEFEGHDVDLHAPKPGYINDHAIEFAQRFNRRLLTAEFRAGDVLIFDHFTAHASFDNGNAKGQVRISCDTRWQPSNDVMDERFQGPNPPAHGGLGYGCLSAAQPLTESGVRR